MLVPRPVRPWLGWAATPAPSSVTERVQLGPRTWQSTTIVPPRSSGKACLRALITSSVMMRPRLTEVRAATMPPSPVTLREILSGSAIMEAAMLSHREMK